VKNALPYGDETYTVILNTTCPKEKVPTSLRKFFSYVISQEIPSNDSFIEQIHHLVEELNGRKEIEQIMTLEEELDVRFSIGKKEGLSEGRKEGEKNALCETARKMKAKGFEANDIAEITGLSLEEIEKI
jgi:predicted transposase/invertase (TIGR01784 family)